MSSPITPVSPGTSSYGLAWKQVTILSVDGDIAYVRDQLSQSFWMSRTNLRAKGDAPQVGETWIVDRSYLNDWTFALIVNKPIRPSQVYVVADSASRDAIVNPDDQMIVYRLDRGYHEIYDVDSETWSATPRTGLIKTLNPTGNLTMASDNTDTVDSGTVMTVSLRPERSYKITYSTRFTQTNAGTMTVSFRYVAGSGPLLVTSAEFLTFTAAGNGSNDAGLSVTKILPSGLSGTYTVGVTLYTESGSGSTTVYGGAAGKGRSVILEDVGVSQM